MSQQMTQGGRRRVSPPSPQDSPGLVLADRPIKEVPSHQEIPGIPKPPMGPRMVPIDI